MSILAVSCVTDLADAGEGSHCPAQFFKLPCLEESIAVLAESSWVVRCGARFGSVMMVEDKIKGPASYFPSIEKKYGRPIDHWLTLVADLHEMKHMERVAFLKSEHGLGHGHANAIVAHVLASRSS